MDRELLVFPSFSLVEFIVLGELIFTFSSNLIDLDTLKVVLHKRLRQSLVFIRIKFIMVFYPPLVQIIQF